MKPFDSYFRRNLFGATCLALEAERTLMFDPAAIITAADAAGIAIVAE